MDGLIHKPEDDVAKEEEWWTVNTMVGSWIINTIEPTLKSTITYVEHCDELRAELKELFSKKNGPR